MESWNERDRAKGGGRGALFILGQLGTQYYIIMVDESKFVVLLPDGQWGRPAGSTDLLAVRFVLTEINTTSKSSFSHILRSGCLGLLLSGHTQTLARHKDDIRNFHDLES